MNAVLDVTTGKQFLEVLKQPNRRDPNLLDIFDELAAGLWREAMLPDQPAERYKTLCTVSLLIQETLARWR